MCVWGGGGWGGAEKYKRSVGEKERDLRIDQYERVKEERVLQRLSQGKIVAAKTRKICRWATSAQENQGG